MFASCIICRITHFSLNNTIHMGFNTSNNFNICENNDKATIKL